MCKFDVQLQDSTGLIIATAFAEIAEKLFKVTAEELYANTINGELALHCMERLSDSRDYVMTQGTMLLTFAPQSMMHNRVQSAGSS